MLCFEYLDTTGKAAPATAAIKLISGSWFEFQHHATVEGVDCNPACACFPCEQWEEKIREISGAGMEYLVLTSTALYYRSFFPTKSFPLGDCTVLIRWKMVLQAADNYGVKFFIGAGFYGAWDNPEILSDRVAERRRLEAIEELARLYAPHPSFIRLVLAE